MRSVAVIGIVLGIAAGPAAAERVAPAIEPDPAEPTEAPAGEPRLIPSASEAGTVPPRREGHRGQLGLSAQLVTGTRFIKTYDGEYCGERSNETANGNATACFNRVPVTLDLTASYGLTRRIELLLEIRLGLERDFGPSPNAGEGPRLRHYAPGARFYFSHDEMVKFFSTAQLAIDTTGYQGPTGDELGTDVAIRNANGVMIDFHDAYGAYAFFGEELAFGRWLEVGLEVGIGIQGRYP